MCTRSAWIHVVGWTHIGISIGARERPSLVHVRLQWQHYYYKPDKTGELIGTPGGNPNGGSTVSRACMHV